MQFKLKFGIIHSNVFLYFFFTLLNVQNYTINRNDFSFNLDLDYIYISSTVSKCNIKFLFFILSFFYTSLHVFSQLWLLMKENK